MSSFFNHRLSPRHPRRGIRILHLGLLFILAGLLLACGQPGSDTFLDWQGEEREERGEGASAQAPADPAALEPVAYIGEYPRMAQDAVRVRVLQVVDGDTMDVELEGQKVRLRLIGMDTPETVHPSTPVQCFGREASERAHELLDEQEVFLQFDPTQGQRDRYGRVLAYVWLIDGRLYNLEMIAGGYAHEYTYNLPYIFQDQFKEAYRQAHERLAGLWAPSTCAGDTKQVAPEVKFVIPTPLPLATPPPAVEAQGGEACDPSYPDVCIPPAPPDLSCNDIPHRAFRVLPPDPHRFDGNQDGIGCEK